MAFEYALFVLAVILFIVFTVIWSLHFISLIYGKFKFHRKVKRVIENEKLPGVSIIKPLTGVDDNLKENLETFFQMDYPLYELLFCVQDNNDPSLNIVKHLIEKYPNVDAKLFCGGRVVGINPKINNMIQGYDAAKYELMLISDAGLKMASDTLYDMVSLMTEKVGLVHQMPFVCDRAGGFAGTLEKVYFGTCHSRMYLFINLIGINCVTGMSCLMRKAVIDKAGGLQKFGVYIAEDYFLAKTFVDNKWVIQLSHQPAMQNSATYSVPAWQKRMIRWCKLRLKLTAASWLEPFQECFMLGLCTSWTVNFLFGWNSLVFFLIHVLGWFLCDYMLLKIVQNGKLPFTKFDYVIAWLYREGICFYLFLKAASNPTVKWRDGKYRLKWGGLAEEIVDPTKNKNISNELGISNPNNTNINSANSSPSSSVSLKKSFLMASSANIVNNNNNTNSNSTKSNTHKRTSSYSVNSNSILTNTNHHNYTSNSDLENSPTVPLLFNSSSNSNLNITKSSALQQPVNKLNNNNNNNPVLFNNQSRSHHQHHHSISSPIHHQSSNNNNNNNNGASANSATQMPNSMSSAALIELSDLKLN